MIFFIEFVNMHLYCEAVKYLGFEQISKEFFCLATGKGIENPSIPTVPLY